MFSKDFCTELQCAVQGAIHVHFWQVIHNPPKNEKCSIKLGLIFVGVGTCLSEGVGIRVHLDLC